MRAPLAVFFTNVVFPEPANVTAKLVFVVLATVPLILNALDELFVHVWFAFNCAERFVAFAPLTPSETALEPGLMRIPLEPIRSTCWLPLDCSVVAAVLLNTMPPTEALAPSVTICAVFTVDWLKNAVSPAPGTVPNGPPIA